MTCSFAIAPNGTLLACQPESPGDQLVLREADQMVGEGELENDYRHECGLTLTDEPVAAMVFTSADNAGWLMDAMEEAFA